jgi:hypothetical protein
MMSITQPTKVPLTKALKIRLLKSIQAGEIDILDYPELQQAGRQAIQIDLEQLTEEELAITVEAVRILDRFPSFRF